MTYAPARLLELRAYLKPITGLVDNDLGIDGDGAHDGGYHEGWDDRHIVNGQTHDYSWLESTRDSSHKTNAASAFDLGKFNQITGFTAWAVDECKKGAPDTLDIREIIYSLDGISVNRWDRLGKRTSGDSSHLLHDHFSWFRDAEDHDKTALFRRYFEGGAALMWVKKGAQGDDALDLQIRLTDVGIYVGDPKNLPPADQPYKYCDGQYGDWTARAVKELGGDGTVFGPWQQKALKDLERTRDLKMVAVPAKFAFSGSATSVSGVMSGTLTPMQ